MGTWKTLKRESGIGWKYLDWEAPITHYISNGSMHSSAYEMSNKIIRASNKTHIAYLKYEGGSHKVYVKTYNHNTSAWGSETLIATVADNHGAPAIAIDSNGYIYIFYDGHTTTLKWRKSTNPNDTTSWGTAAAIPNQATKPVYPSVVIDSSNNVHLIYRETNGGAIGCFYQKYNGSSWSSATEIAQGTATYRVSYSNSIAIDSNNVLHVIFTFWENSTTYGKKACYMKSTDGGSTWKKTDDTEYTLPVTYAAAETVETGGDLRVGTVAVDGGNHPMFVAVRKDHTPKDMHFWRYNGTSWVSKTLSVTGKSINQYVTTSYYNNIIYVFASVATTYGWPPSNDAEVYIFYSSDNGANFTQKQISTTDASNPNWLPNAEQDNSANTLTESRLLWTNGGSNPAKIYFAKINANYDAEPYGFAGVGWKALAWKGIYEDFTTFTEVDTGNDRIQKTANHIDHYATRNEDTYLYKDYGDAHFGNFTHKIKAQSGFTQDFSVGYVWCLANDIDDFRGLGNGGKTAISVRFYRNGSDYKCQLYEVYNSSWYGDEYIGISSSTYYYIKIVKSGTSLTAYIYSDPNYSTLIDTLVLTLHGNWTFRYLYGCNTHAAALGDYQINDIENFDIGE